MWSNWWTSTSMEKGPKMHSKPSHFCLKWKLLELSISGFTGDFKSVLSYNMLKLWTLNIYFKAELTIKMQEWHVQQWTTEPKTIGNSWLDTTLSNLVPYCIFWSVAKQPGQCLLVQQNPGSSLRCTTRHRKIHLCTAQHFLTHREEQLGSGVRNCVYILILIGQAFFICRDLDCKFI